MSKEKVEDLISSLHERFADDLVSPQQQKLMDELRNHMHAMDENDQSTPDLQDTLGALLEDVEHQHPQAAIVVREVLEALKNMGI
jgi:hypothetical protein